MSLPQVFEHTSRPLGLAGTLKPAAVPEESAMEALPGQGVTSS